MMESGPSFSVLPGLQRYRCDPFVCFTKMDFFLGEHDFHGNHIALLKSRSFAVDIRYFAYRSRTSASDSSCDAVFFRNIVGSAQGTWCRQSVRS